MTTEEAAEKAPEDSGLTEEQRIEVDLAYSRMKSSGELRAREDHRALMADLNGHW